MQDKLDVDKVTKAKAKVKVAEEVKTTATTTNTQLGKPSHQEIAN